MVISRSGHSNTYKTNIMLTSLTTERSQRSDICQIYEREHEQ